MKHHFADFLDRDGDYWTVVPNRKRFAHEFQCIDEGDPTISVALIGKGTQDWQKCLALPNLQEITLQNATAEQFEAVCDFPKIKRLRITHLRPKHIGSITKLNHLEELVLEYVSGFSDLSPLSRIPNLKSLHLENLRGVRDFTGLSNCRSLRYLSIFGTSDWNQPIDNFEFLRWLPKLEHLGFSFVTSTCEYPAFLPAIALNNIRSIHLAPHYFATQEYALLSVILDGVKGADWGAYRRLSYRRMPLPSDDPRHQLTDEEIKEKHSDISISIYGEREITDPNSEWFEFIGKRAGRVKCTNPKSGKQCAEATRHFEEMKSAARMFIYPQR